MREVFIRHKIVPVLVFLEATHATSVAEALTAGGLPLLEITLRTDAALNALEAVSNSNTNAIVGVGTVLETKQLQSARNAGARFAVSPGFDPAIAAEADKCGIFYLPGVATASEVMLARRAGYRFLKFFPAAAAGGIPLIRSFASPFHDITFCPTGGIGPDNLSDYLKLPNVGCVGGSWLATLNDMKAGEWKKIERKARDAVALALSD
ncbi:MAG: bifunctional 4-hydroxy-2-oxoglutarate aldolase/2-dehydro-3-deoxy-phosphogluconate aldolase [Pseudomonadota bacterium]|nr:bifunctional 4-hydroxy-2-oxoglutarate aldolase/2-dehydro-3-deoxy-phosphogluconate aldolase [Pseudomonadota bacterium]